MAELLAIIAFVYHIMACVVEVPPITTGSDPAHVATVATKDVNQ